MHHADFGRVLFNERPIDVKQYSFFVNGRCKRLFYATRDNRIVVIMPHLSGSPLLASNAAIDAAGTSIACLLAELVK